MMMMMMMMIVRMVRMKVLLTKLMLMMCILAMMTTKRMISDELYTVSHMSAFSTHVLYIRYCTIKYRIVFLLWNK